MEKVHKQRILTAVITLPLIIWLIVFSPFFLFFIFIFFVGFIASLEQVNLWHLPNKNFSFFYTLLSLIVLLGFAFSSPVLGLLMAFFILSIYFIWTYGHKSEISSFFTIGIFSIIYPNLLLGHAFSFLTLPQGRKFLLWILFIVFAADTGAFYMGRKFGKHKIYPAVSPKKSWEGLIGCIGSAFILGIIASFFLPLNTLKILFLSFIIAIFEQIGDFFESALKRQAGCKDSGKILPGHGGMLDRIDGVLFALPVSYYFLSWWLK
ncbi:MAG TPA: hypothetical protein ENG63_00520 [Candidatus Desulfofervidus auxilii]|uniref:Phosphatidate cytidylyltransferase n=1 Tax=Desulfofervidus auxilii TaxID=1621989 RepID=A0A7C0Y8R2_DESA2|nr:hypothetical protein [Candidatus Desulfofervidus auxilii]